MIGPRFRVAVFYGIAGSRSLILPRLGSQNDPGGHTPEVPIEDDVHPIARLVRHEKLGIWGNTNIRPSRKPALKAPLRSIIK